MIIILIFNNNKINIKKMRDLSPTAYDLQYVIHIEKNI